MKRLITKAAVQRFAVRSTTASAKLERRAVPASYVRSAHVAKFLAEWRSRTR